MANLLKARLGHARPIVIKSRTLKMSAFGDTKAQDNGPQSLLELVFAVISEESCGVTLRLPALVPPSKKQ